MNALHRWPLFALFCLLLALDASLENVQGQTVYPAQTLPEFLLVPTPPPAGTLYLTEYVSARTKTGGAGFVPGQEVRLVRRNNQTGKVFITDGKYQIEVAVWQLTDKPEVAATLRRHDEEKQRMFREARDAALLAREKSRQQHEDAMKRTVLNEDLRLAGLPPVKTTVGIQTTRLTPGREPEDVYETSYEMHGNPYTIHHAHILRAVGLGFIDAESYSHR